MPLATYLGAVRSIPGYNVMGLAKASLEASLEIARKADLQWHMGPTLLGLDHIRACAGRVPESSPAARLTEASAPFTR